MSESGVMVAVPSLERALEINNAMVAHVLSREGIVPAGCGVPSLEPYSLLEMVLASRVIRNAEESGPSEDGRRTISVCPDDRLVAALYVGTHYEAKPPDEVEISAVVGDAAVLVVKLDPEDLVDEDEASS